MDCTDGDEDHSYDLNSNKFCYIINNKEFASSFNLNARTGTDNDFKMLKKLFDSLNFKVEYHKNCDKETTLDNLKKLSSRQDLENYSLFMLIILSHGDDENIHATNELIPIRVIIEFFKGDKCKALVGKPKLFFFQACRGDKCNEEIETDSYPSSSSIDKIPIEADILIAYSTVPGYLSWGNSDGTKGSWYIQALCRFIEKYAKTDDLVRILVKVNNFVATQFRSNAGDLGIHGKVQIPSFTCMLRKQVWLAEDDF